MITPLDIQNREFAKGVRGYKEEDVDSFLDLVTTDMEIMLSENAALKEAVRRLEAELEKYRSSETAVVETLEAAKGLMRDIAISSEKRAEVLLKNAELDAELITKEARESANRLKEESAALRNRFNDFRAGYKRMLENEMERFDSVSNAIFEEFAMPLEKLELTEKSLKHKNTITSEPNFVNKIESDVDDIKKTMVNFKLGEGDK
ncbi:MAG: DivIVA domain-containing protein [Clostridiales bacterium]|jgi:divIVA family protein|nr:DivIVA domain-containing protein [Clostridiales bacterium]